MSCWTAGATRRCSTRSCAGTGRRFRARICCCRPPFAYSRLRRRGTHGRRARSTASSGPGVGRRRARAASPAHRGTRPGAPTPVSTWPWARRPARGEHGGARRGTAAEVLAGGRPRGGPGPVTPGGEVLTGVITHGRLEEDGGDAGDRRVPQHAAAAAVRCAVTAGSTSPAGPRPRAAHRGHRRYPYAQMLRDHGDCRWTRYVNFMDFHQRWGTEAAIQDGFGVAETNFPLAANFLVDPVGGRLGLWLDCDTSRWTADFCRRLAGYYARPWPRSPPTVGAAARRAAGAAGAPSRSRQWSGTAAPYDTTVTVADLIAPPNACDPGRGRSWTAHERLSYAELDRRADRLARCLRATGRRTGRPGRGRACRRSAGLVVALLAVPVAARPMCRWIRTFRPNGCVTSPRTPDWTAWCDRPRGDAGVAGGRRGGGGAVARVDRRAASRRRRRLVGGRTTPVYVIYTSGRPGAPRARAAAPQRRELLHRHGPAVGIGPGDGTGRSP